MAGSDFRYTARQKRLRPPRDYAVFPDKPPCKNKPRPRGMKPAENTSPASRASFGCRLLFCRLTTGVAPCRGLVVPDCLYTATFDLSAWFRSIHRLYIAAFDDAVALGVKPVVMCNACLPFPAAFQSRTFLCRHFKSGRTCNLAPFFEANPSSASTCTCGQTRHASQYEYFLHHDNSRIKMVFQYKLNASGMVKNLQPPAT